jgi:hypothetical protein
VPRWLWPPPGATVTRVVLREQSTRDGAVHTVAQGEEPDPKHLRALQWLVGEFARPDAPPNTPGVVEVLLEVARTDLRGGRVGHAYALDGGALGAPGNHVARGVLWRYALARLGHAPDSFAKWEGEI